MSNEHMEDYGRVRDYDLLIEELDSIGSRDPFVILPGEATRPCFVPGVDYAALKTDLEIVSA